MKKLLFAACFSVVSLAAPAQAISKAAFKEDFDYYWTTIKENYCYWDKKQTDWDRVKERYAPQADTITSKKSFIGLLETVFTELYDHHASLNTNTRESYRLVPSGADIWAEYVNGKPVITEVRPGFGAYNAGMKAGMEIIACNDVPVEQAIQPLLAKSLKTAAPEARNYALRVLLAGRHTDTRKITVRYQHMQQDYYPDAPINLLEEHNYTSDIESRVLAGNTGYLRINNRLWDNHLVPQFDSVLQSLAQTSRLILDLRETPGGGNTTVARAIMGSFISKEGFYQRHELAAEERESGIQRSWMEIVSPRKHMYDKPLIILASHWTGSVGEGITIGFDALKRATIIGTPMAGLNGANYSFTLPHTQIGFSFPAEKLFHVNGTPREQFRPTVIVDLSGQMTGEDTILATALDYARKHK